MSREQMLKQRLMGYALKFVNDSDAAPTDENLESVLDHCVRPAHADEYPAIRQNVISHRMRGIQLSDYALVSQNGRRIRTATQVTLADGGVIRFTEKLSKREAMRNAQHQVSRDGLR